MMLINELLNKDPYIFPEEAPMIKLDSKFDVCMSKNVKDTEHTRHISRRMNFVRNDSKCQMLNIDWCKGGMQQSDIANNNVGEHDLTPRMKYIMKT